MKASELRIGNYVEESVLGVVTVSTIEPELVWVESKNMKSSHVIESSYYHVDVGSIKPVPLTEEWLLKFGFEADAVLIKYKKTCGDCVMSISANAFSGSLWFISILTGYGSQPATLIGQYVHQLQNLYFALTRGELTVKE